MFSVLSNAMRIGTWLVTWFNYLTVAITSTAFIPSSFAAEFDNAIDAPPPVLTMTIPKPEHCVKKHSVQFLDVSNIDNSDSDMFKLAHIPGTNLLVIGFTDFNSSSVTFAEQSTYRVPTEVSCVTEMQRYRKNTTTCMDTRSYSEDNESIVGCGAVSIHMSVLLVIINILALLFSNTLFSS